jgi:serine/threonine protein kinase
VNLSLPKGFSHPVKIGAGGFGVVYRVRQNTVGRLVALKFIDEKDRHLKASLKKEAAMQADLQIYGIPQIYDVLEFSGRICIIMQWLKGCSLRSLLETNLSIIEKQAIALEIIKITASLHNRGYAHRDLKPDNIIISSEGIYLIDFGLARNATIDAHNTMTGIVKGTPAYLAPELLQGKGNTADPICADVYSLGKVIQELYETEHLPMCINQCLRDKPDLRQKSAVELLFQWESDVGRNLIVWSQIAEPYSSEILAKQLHNAANLLINVHRTTEAYELLVECLQLDPELSEAIELIEQFPVIKKKNSLKTKLNILIIGLITILISLTSIYLSKSGSHKHINNFFLRAENGDNKSLLMVPSGNQSKSVDSTLPFKEEPIPIRSIYGRIIITSQLTTGTLIFN